jgi:Ca2+/Na+ antiporter
MSEDPGKELVGRAAALSGGLALVVGLVAWWRGAPLVAWGYVGGTALGVLSLAGIALVVSSVILSPQRVRRGRKGAAIPVTAQILKFLVLVAGLYLLVAHYRFNEWAIFFGLLTPMALALALALRRAGPRSANCPRE